MDVLFSYTVTDLVLAAPTGQTLTSAPPCAAMLTPSTPSLLTEWGGGRKRKNKPKTKPPPKDKFAYMSAGTKNGGADYNPPSRGAVEMACQMKDELLKKVEELGKRLPANTLDELIDQLGGTENVAEVGLGRFGM